MAKKIIDTSGKNLSPEEIKILARVVRDPLFFSLFCFVINPVHGKVPFHLYPYQNSVLYQFLLHRFNIILKGRQMGVTELISMYCLWLAMYHENKKINIISIKDTVAKKVLKKIKFMYKNLPWYLQVPIINGRSGEYGNQTDMEFSNGSFITSIPTTEQAGRSESLSLLVIDEAAAVRWASTIWASAAPTLSTGGSAILNSCITGDTEIIGRNGNFKVEQICPKEFGVQDVRFMNLEVLSHKLQWKKVLYGVNKGVLETWEIINEHGDIIKCTPAHKFLTPKGWKTAQEIIKKGLYTIRYCSGISALEDLPVVHPPEKEIYKEVKGYPNYLISNHGRVRIKSTGEEKIARPNAAGYLRVKLWNKGSNKTFTLSKLVVENFIGDIPPGYVVDHINCDKKVNHVNNLQIITSKENAARATRFSRGLKLNSNTGKGASDVELVGYIKYLDKLGYSHKNILRKVKSRFGKSLMGSYVTRVTKSQRNRNIELSKLRVIRKYSDNIYDLTVEGDESYISNSNYISHNTPLGMGNFYHSTWSDAVSGLNGFNPIRLHWDLHPERDMAWYEQMSKMLGPKRTAQEIDGDFLSSGNTVFEMTDIRAIEQMLSEYPAIKTRFNGQYREYNEPDPTKEYFFGADVATGRSRDYSAFSGMDRDGEEVASYKGKIPINKYGKLLGDVGRRWNYALLAPETNDIGIAVTSYLQDEGYPNLYHFSKLVKKKGTRKPEVEKYPGWLTTSKNRSPIVEGLETDIREDNIIIKNPHFVYEGYTFIYDGTGRPVAMGKHNRNSSVDVDLEADSYTDDSIFATAITNHIRKTSKSTTTTTPK